MTSIHEGYGDLLDSDDTEIRHCLIGALDHIYTGAVLPPSTGDSILAAIRHPGASLMDIKDTTEPLSAVPPHTFDLNPPSGSHVIP